MAEHSNYPHNPGTLYDCEACEEMYYSIVFLDGDEAFKVIEMDTFEGALEYLKQWDYGDESEHSPTKTPWGSDDKTFVSGDYVMAWNWHLNYVSLNRKVLPA